MNKWLIVAIVAGVVILGGAYMMKMKTADKMVEEAVPAPVEVSAEDMAQVIPPGETQITTGADVSTAVDSFNSAALDAQIDADIAEVDRALSQ